MKHKVVERLSHIYLRGGQEIEGFRIAIIAASKITIIWSNNGVGLVSADIGTFPLKKEKKRRVTEWSSGQECHNREKATKIQTCKDKTE